MNRILDSWGTKINNALGDSRHLNNVVKEIVSNNQSNPLNVINQLSSNLKTIGYIYNKSHSRLLKQSIMEMNKIIKNVYSKVECNEDFANFDKSKLTYLRDFKISENERYTTKNKRSYAKYIADFYDFVNYISVYDVQIKDIVQDPKDKVFIAKASKVFRYYTNDFEKSELRSTKPILFAYSCVMVVILLLASFLAIGISVWLFVNLSLYIASALTILLGIFSLCAAIYILFCAVKDFKSRR